MMRKLFASEDGGAKVLSLFAGRFWPWGNWLCLRIE